MEDLDKPKGTAAILTDLLIKYGLTPLPGVSPGQLLRMAQAAGEEAGHELDKGPVGLSPQTRQKFADLGLYNQPNAPHSLLSGVRSLNEAMISPAAAALETLDRASNAIGAAIGAAAGQAVGEGVERAGGRDGSVVQARHVTTELGKIGWDAWHMWHALHYLRHAPALFNGLQRGVPPAVK